MKPPPRFNDPKWSVSIIQAIFGLIWISASKTWQFRALGIGCLATSLVLYLAYRRALKANPRA